MWRRLRRDAVTGPGNESGFSLIELLIAVMIISLVFVAIFSGLTETVQSTGVQRREATGETYIRQIAETLLQQNSGGIGTLSSALTTGAPVTSIAVTPLNNAVAKNESLLISVPLAASGVQSQPVTASANAAQGATTIPVTSFTPNFAYPAGSYVAGTYTNCPAYTDISPPSYPAAPTFFTTPSTSTLPTGWKIEYGLPSLWTPTSTTANWDFKSITWYDAAGSYFGMSGSNLCNNFYSNYCDVANSTAPFCLDAVQRITIAITSTDPATNYKQWSGTTQVVLRRGNDGV